MGYHSRALDVVGKMSNTNKGSGLSTQELLEAIHNGNDRFVFERLYLHCLPKILVLIESNKGNKDEAYDIFQDALIVLYKQAKLGMLKEGFEVDGFIYSVARNLWINRAKKLNRHAPLDNQQLNQPDIDFEQVLIDDERRSIVSDVLSLLGVRCKELLTYTIYHHLKMEEIAKKMNFSSVNTVKTKHYKCKQRLIKLVKENKGFKELLQDG